MLRRPSSPTVFTVNEVLNEWLGDIFKQLNLSCFNTKHLLKAVLCLQERQMENQSHPINPQKITTLIC